MHVYRYIHAVFMHACSAHGMNAPKLIRRRYGVTRKRKIKLKVGSEWGLADVQVHMDRHGKSQQRRQNVQGTRGGEVKNSWTRTRTGTRD